MNEMTLLVNAARTDPILRDAALAVEKRLLEAQRSYETAERAAVMWMERAEAAEAALADLRAENERLVEKVIAGELLDRERAEAAEAALAEAQQQIKDQDRRIRCQRTALAGLNRMTEGDSHYAGRKRAEAALAEANQRIAELESR